MQTTSPIRKDFITSNLRSQIEKLRSVLGDMEDKNEVDCVFTFESLKEIEGNIRSIRKICEQEI